MAVPDSPVSPTPAPVSPQQPGIASVEIAPGAVLGGDGATGIIRLTGPAQSPGLFVSMSSSDDVAIVSPTIGIPTGNTFARFGVTTRRVEGDRTAMISASTPGSTVTTRFDVWMINAPFHFLYFSGDEEPIGQGGFGRFVPSTATFSATCNRNQVRIQVSAPGRDTWSLTFKGPGNDPLKVEFYDAARIGFDDRWPGMDLIAGGRSCDAINGYFTVDEIDLSNNRVNVLRGSFQQECLGHPGRLYGEFRVENMPAGTSANCPR